MYRQGKYTKRLTSVQKAQRNLRTVWRRWGQLSWKKKTLIIGVPVFVIAILGPLFTYLYFARDISNIDRLMNRNDTGVAIYAEDGKTPLYSTGTAGHRNLVPLNGISKPMQQALVASEDKNFYHHDSFSFLSTLRAIYTFVISGGRTYGGSTLTQQLAKITLLSDQRSFLREYQSFSVAIAIEHTYSKDQILDMYLNSAYFGGDSFGIQDAAKNYFGTTPDKLTTAQSAMLVGLLPAPNVYSPITGNATYARERQTTVLNRMETVGNITEAQKQAALGEELQYAAKGSSSDIDNAAPHFTQMILQQLYKKYGEETVLRSGYRVTTTLDMGLQQKANAAVANHMNYIRREGGSNAGLVAIDPQNGEIRAMVGSYDYTNQQFGEVNMATTARQPGSSFKPIYYSYALAHGAIAPTTVLQDTPHNWDGYQPLDADRRFRGNVTPHQALDWSLNIPSVEVAEKMGIPSVVQAAKNLGITTMKSPSNYGLSIALGVQEVPLVEMTNAYAAFANQGQQYNYSSIKSIQDKYGANIFTVQRQSHEAVSPQAAFLISHILSDRATQSIVFGNTLYVRGTDGRLKTVAVKTGTTNDNRDAWTIGYTPNMAIGVWVGNNDNAQMYDGGSDMAGPIWSQLMGQVIGANNPSFVQPSGITKATVCNTMGVLSDYFLSTYIPDQCNGNVTPQKTTPENTTQQPSNNSDNSGAKCNVAGKEDLSANDPNCQSAMCTVPGKTNIAANDPNCKAATAPDSDNDGVPDSIDQCPGTSPGATVNAIGCAAGQTPVSGGAGSGSGSGSGTNGP